MVERDKGRLILKFLSKVETARELKWRRRPGGCGVGEVHVPDRLLVSVVEAEHLVLLTADAALIALARKEPRLPLRSA